VNELPKLTLGVLTLYLNRKRTFEERHYFRLLTLAGKKLGVDVCVFTPENVDESRRLIHAHIYDTAARKWKRKWIPYPDLFMDRSRFHSISRYRAIAAFRRRNPALRFLSSPMGNKWKLYQLLVRRPAVRPFLPHTTLYRRFDDLRRELLARKTVFLKPIHGTGGRDILRIERMAPGVYAVRGRTKSRRIIPERRVNLLQLRNLVVAKKPANRYIIQQAIDVRLKNGSVHDYRMLVQKNGNGKWEVTGCAGRVGPAGSVTSNLHGGGRAVPMMKLLAHWLQNPRLARKTAEDIYAFGLLMGETLESIFGRLCEFGLDIAVDHNRNIWLLEVNSKPSRQVFIRIGDKAAYARAISRPLEYARWLHQQAGRSETAVNA